MMRFASGLGGLPVDPRQGVAAGRTPQPGERRQHGDQRQGEERQADRAGKRRKVEPHAEPREAQEGQDHADPAPQDRPCGFPEAGGLRAGDESVEPPTRVGRTGIVVLSAAR